MLTTFISNQLHIVAINADRHRPLNQLDGDHQALVGVLGRQDPFDPVQTSPADPYALSHIDERVDRTGEVP